MRRWLIRALGGAAIHRERDLVLLSWKEKVNPYPAHFHRPDVKHHEIFVVYPMGIGGFGKTKEEAMKMVCARMELKARRELPDAYA